MLIYLLKSSVCLLAFSLFYKLFLERETIHVFKRFYLLGSLILAFYIPFITFTTYTEQAVVDFQVSSTTVSNTIEKIPIEESISWTPIILWVVYGLGVLFFAAKFLLNLYKLIQKINQNEKIQHQDYVHVLLLKHIVPHTFMKYIFLEKRAFNDRKIPQEILLHEQTHAQQKHSLDILLVELLQIAFWFNPLIYLFKKDIKLNHEFLADREVINHGYNTKNYQNILLCYSSKQAGYHLESAINYSSIKKRFTLMKTHTSKTAIWLRSLVVLPLLAFLVYSFSGREEMIKEKPISEQQTNIVDDSYLEIEVDENNFLFHNNQQIQIEDIANLVKLEDGLQIKLIYKVEVSNQEELALKRKIINFINSQGVSSFGICSSFTSLDGIKNDFSISKDNLVENKEYGSNTEINVNTTREIFPLLILNNGTYINCNNCTVGLKKELIKDLKLSTNTKEKVSKFKIKFPGKPTEHINGNGLNEVALKNLEASSNDDYLILFDIETGKQTLNSNITIKVIKSIPPPPPPIPANATSEQKTKYKRIQDEYYRKYKIEGVEMINIPPPPPPKEKP